MTLLFLQTKSRLVDLKGLALNRRETHKRLSEKIIRILDFSFKKQHLLFIRLLVIYANLGALMFALN